MATIPTPPLEVLRRFAPGTVLREAARLIFNQGTGALIVIGPEDEVDALSTGGFRLRDVPVTAPRIAELAKMDGGIVIDDEHNTIERANVHFIPDPNIPTRETGTRFRTAERIALQTGLSVLAVSEEGRNVAVLFAGPSRLVLQAPMTLLAVANQRLQSLERLRRRLDEAVVRLNQYEEDEIVTMRDAVMVIQRAMLVLRHVDDLEQLAVELGEDAGRRGDRGPLPDGRNRPRHRSHSAGRGSHPAWRPRARLGTAAARHGAGRDPSSLWNLRPAQGRHRYGAEQG